MTFFEDIRSGRLMEVVADRSSIRWFLGYDLDEPLPDHFRASPASANATVWRSSGASSRRSRRSASRRGSGVREGTLPRCDRKVEANASLDSMGPRLLMEDRLARSSTRRASSPRRRSPKKAQTRSRPPPWDPPVGKAKHSRRRTRAGTLGSLKPGAGRGGASMGPQATGGS